MTTSQPSCSPSPGWPSCGECSPAWDRRFSETWQEHRVRGARPLWVVVSGTCTLKGAAQPPQSSCQVVLPLSQQTRNQVFRVPPAQPA